MRLTKCHVCGSCSRPGAITNTIEQMEMETSGQLTLTQHHEPVKKKRKSYTRENKLKVVYVEGERNLYRTCKKYSLNTKMVVRWINDEEKIRDSHKGSKRVKFQQTAQFPDMEKQLYAEYKDFRKKGLKVRRPGKVNVV